MRSTILLVEDDEALRSTLARHLRAHGHDVAEVDSAEDAIARLGRGLRPDLVLLDINLPGDTGWSLLRSPALPQRDRRRSSSRRRRRQPAPAPRVRRRRLPAQALPARDPALDRRAPARAGDGGRRSMTDLTDPAHRRSAAWPPSPATCGCATGCADERPRPDRRHRRRVRLRLPAVGAAAPRGLLSMPTDDFLTLVAVVAGLLLITPILGRLHLQGHGGRADAPEPGPPPGRAGHLPRVRRSTRPSSRAGRATRSRSS